MKLDLSKVDAASAAEAQRLLGELDGVYSENPLQRFRPLVSMPEQERFLAAGERVKLFAGGNRAGKTTVGVVDDLVQAVDVGCLPVELRRFKRWEPPFFCRVIAPDMNRTMEVVFDKLREWCPRGQLRGGSWDRAFDKTLRKLHFKNGSWFDFLSQEMDLDKFGGQALHRVHFDEEPAGDKGRAIFNESLVRLIDFGGQVSLTMTPLIGITWTHDEIWERRAEPDVFAVAADMENNSTLDSVARDAILAGYSKEERQARKEGRFVHFHGLVYAEWDDAQHLVDVPEREHVQGLSTIVGVDPGMRWTGLVWVGFDSDNQAVVYDELLVEQGTVADVAEQIREKNKQWGVEPDFYVIDPSARNRSQVNAENVEGEFARNGIFCVHGQNQVEAGVFYTKRLLQHGGLTVARSCGGLVREVGRYRVDPRADGKFAVIKTDDHLLDALRYALMSRAWGVEKELRPRARSFDESWAPPGLRAREFPTTGSFT